MTSAELGKQRRMGRLSHDGKLLVVPIDDSLIFGPFDGLFHIEDTIRAIESSGPSAILGYKGSLSLIHSSNIPIILNVTASTTIGNHVSKVVTSSICDALRLNADCVAAHVNFTSDCENEMLRNLSEVICAADNMGLPVLAISYPRKCIAGKDYNYLDLDEKSYTDLICHCTRTSVELGADIIKTQFTGSAMSFEKVVKSAMGRPVIIAGGPLKEVKEAYTMAKAVIDAGGAGVSFGRNVFNATDIPAFVAGLKEIIYEGANVDRALLVYREVFNVRLE